MALSRCITLGLGQRSVLLRLNPMLHTGARRPPQLPARCFSARSEHMDGDVRLFMRYKRIFGAALCVSTLVAAFWLKKRKGDRLRDILQDCVRIRTNDGVFKPTTSLYRYSGCVLAGQIVLSGVLQQLPTFQFREEDVLVASFPKTGTTWVQEIVYMLRHDCRASEPTDPTLETRFPYLEYPYPGMRTVARTAGPRCIKTHLPYHLLPPSVREAGTKVIYVSRNPRDTAVAYYHFVKLLTTSGFIGTFHDFIDLFLKDTVPYSPFHGHVRGYCHQQETDDSIFCVTYEQLSQDPATVVRKIAHHLNVIVSEEDIQYVVSHTSFHAMAGNASVNYEHWKDVGFANTRAGNFLRKGKVGDWMNSLSDSQMVRFQEWEEKQTLPGDLKFVYKLPPNDTNAVQ